MTMEHVKKEATAARQALGALADAARKRKDEVAAKLSDLDQETDKTLIGARAAVQAIDDDRRVAVEELDQLNGVLGDPDTADGPVSDASDRQPSRTTSSLPLGRRLRPTLYTVEELEEMDDNELLDVVNFWLNDMDTEVNLDVYQRPIWINFVVTQQSIYCVSGGIDDPNDTRVYRVETRRFRDRIDPRSWTIWSWIGAAVGLLVALIIWSIWPEWIGRNMDPSGVRTALNFLWFVALVGTGFFGGAIIGAQIEDQNDDS